MALVDHPKGSFSEALERESSVGGGVTYVNWGDLEPPLEIDDPLPRRGSSNVALPKGKRLISFIKRRFVWILYLTMIIQVGANIGVLTALPGILTNDALYSRNELTHPVITSQCVPLFATCVITHLVLGEWHFVRYRYHLQQGDLLGVVGMLLLFVTAVAIDACRLIQAHMRLVDIRRHDGTNETVYSTQCLQTYVNLARDLDYARLTLTPVEYLIDKYQCCGPKKNLTKNFAFYPNVTTNLRMENLTSAGFRCCSSECTCNSNNGSMSTMCLTKLVEEMGGVYSSTYPIYIVFVLASVSSILAFLHYNSQPTEMQ